MDEKIILPSNAMQMMQKLYAPTPSAIIDSETEMVNNNSIISQITIQFVIGLEKQLN